MKATIIVRTDKDVKEGATQLAKEMGVPLSVLVNAQLKNLIQDKQITFSVPYKMTPYLERLTARVHKDIKTGRNIAGPFNSAKEAIAYLKSR